MGIAHIFPATSGELKPPPVEKTKLTDLLLIFQTGTKLKSSPPVRSASTSSCAAKSRMRRKSASPSKVRKVKAQKRPRKQQKPNKKPASPQESSSSNPGEDVAKNTGENEEKVTIDISSVVEESAKETAVKTEEIPCQEKSRDAQTGNDVKPEVEVKAAPAQKPPSVNILRKILLEEDDAFTKAAIFERLKTEVKGSPMLNALNVEVRGGRDSPNSAKRSRHSALLVKFPRCDVTEGDNNMAATRKFRCSKCGMSMNSRSALTFHYNTKHIHTASAALLRQDGTLQNTAGQASVFLCSSVRGSPAILSIRNCASK